MSLSSTRESPIPGPVFILPRWRIAQAAGLMALGALAVPGLGAAPAAAALSQGWEVGCAVRPPSGIPGQGQAMLNDRCQSLRSCAMMAADGKIDLALAGCFGFDERHHR